MNRITPFFFTLLCFSLFLACGSAPTPPIFKGVQEIQVSKVHPQSIDFRTKLIFQTTSNHAGILEDIDMLTYVNDSLVSKAGIWGAEEFNYTRKHLQYLSFSFGAHRFSDPATKALFEDDPVGQIVRIRIEGIAKIKVKRKVFEVPYSVEKNVKIYQPGEDQESDAEFRNKDLKW